MTIEISAYGFRYSLHTCVEHKKVHGRVLTAYYYYYKVFPKLRNSMILYIKPSLYFFCLSINIIIPCGSKIGKSQKSKDNF